MKKFRVVVMTIAIVVSVGAAFANTQNPCIFYEQFYKQGDTYPPVPGNYGYHYICVSMGSVCAYWQQDIMKPDYFVPCRTGTLLKPY
jgi:hypothetical protein